MTVYVVLSVKDRALDAYMQPIFVPTVGMGVRSFTDEVNRKDSPMNAHPEDYDLYQIGIFDDSTGSLASANHLRCVSRGQDVIQR